MYELVQPISLGEGAIFYIIDQSLIDWLIFHIIQNLFKTVSHLI